MEIAYYTNNELADNEHVENNLIETKNDVKCV